MLKVIRKCSILLKKQKQKKRNVIFYKDNNEVLMLFWWATLNSKFALWFNNGYKICKFQNNKTLNLDWLFYENSAATRFATRVFRPRLCWNFHDTLAESRPLQNTEGSYSQVRVKFNDFQGLLKASPTVFKELKLMKNTAKCQNSTSELL